MRVRYIWIVVVVALVFIFRELHCTSNEKSGYSQAVFVHFGDCSVLNFCRFLH